MVVLMSTEGVPTERLSYTELLSTCMGGKYNSTNNIHRNKSVDKSR